MDAFEFDRYVNGVLMAEGVTIERQATLEGATRVAARIASRGPNDEVPVLVLRRAPGFTILHDSENHGPTRVFRLGDRVTKTKGSSWTGHVVGFYSTGLTLVGYAVESENEPGSVQIYPESALRRLSAQERDDAR